MTETNSLNILLVFSLYLIQKVTSIEAYCEYGNFAPFNNTKSTKTPTIHNELLDQVSNKYLSTIDMNYLISDDQLANMPQNYADENADFKNYNMNNCIIFIPIISIISVILFMKNGYNIRFICFLIF
eukprot:182002_1